MKPVNILFINVLLNKLVPGGQELFLIPTTPLYLNAYLTNTRPDLAEQIVWKDYIFKRVDQEHIITSIIEQEIDVLCCSIYVWNEAATLEMIDNIKQRVNRPLTVIVGGPSVSHRDPTFLDRHPDIDYAVYAQGEKPFALIMDKIINGVPIPRLDARNLIWRHKGKNIIADFEFLRIDGSPYVESEQLLRQIIACAPQNSILEIPYETSRGCPYECTFCDWMAGLTTKMHKRKFTYEDELELLGRLGIFRLHVSDSNFGIFKQDIEIARTFVRLKQEKGYPFFMKTGGLNFSKLNKKANFEIFDILYTGGIIKSIKVSVQDIHPEILNNIDRPDIPWEEHKQYVKEFKAKHPDLKPIQFELITGIPGQTRDTWRQSLTEASKMGFHISFQPWADLPNSPMGQNLEYREKMKIRTFPFDVVGNGVMPIVIESYSYTFQDWVYFSMMCRVYNFIIRNIPPEVIQFEAIAKALAIHPEAEKYFNHVVSKLEKAGIIRFADLMIGHHEFFLKYLHIIQPVISDDLYQKLCEYRKHYNREEVLKKAVYIDID